MADKQIKIGLFADDQASAKLERVGAAAESAGGKLRGADAAARDTGDGFERAGETADASETRILGLKDAVDGTAVVMAGPGKVGITAYIQGWADVASGLANFVIPSLGKLSPANIRAAATATRAAVATRAQGAASRVAAAGTWALNVAMRANPIGLVITALVALGVGLVLAYRRSETFRRIVQAGFRAVLVAGRALGSGIAAVARGIGAAFSAVGGAIAAPFRAAFGGIKSAWNATVGGRGFSVPDWIPGIGGREFRIPMLARGGVVTRPTLAMIGEAGDEAVVPLDRWNGGRGPDDGRPLLVQLVLDSKVIHQALLKLKRDNNGELGLA